MTDERVSYFTGTDAKPIQIWIWKSWLLVVCSLTLFTPWELKPHQKVWRRCVICLTQTVAQEMHRTEQRAGIIIIIDYHMRSCLAIEFSHEFDSKYYIGTLAHPKPSFETQTTQIFKVVPKSTNFIGFLLNPIWGTSEIFELTTTTTEQSQHNNFSQLSSSSLLPEVRKIFQWISQQHCKIYFFQTIIQTHIHERMKGRVLFAEQRISETKQQRIHQTGDMIFCCT